MKKANKFSIPKLIRKSCATTLVLVLLPHPWVSEARAQSAINVGMQAITTLSSTIQQGMMQAQAMRPVNLAPSQVRSVPAVNLPAPLNECLISPAKIPMPRYCEEIGPPSEYISPAGLAASPTFNQFSQTSEFAKQQIIELDRMLDMGKNEASNVARTGIQCLNDKQLKEKTRRQAVQNAIQARIDEIKQKNEAFKEQVKIVELQMNKTRGELLGAESQSDPAHLSNLINPPIKNMPASCQSMVEKANENSQQLGLYFLKEGVFRPQSRKAGEYLANETQFQDDLQRFINESRQYVARYGIDSFRANGLPNFKGNQALVERIRQSLGPFERRIEIEEQTIRSELEKVGYQAPRLDQNFKSDFDLFKSDSKKFFRKKAINECVTGGNNGITLDPETILNSLRQESTNNQGTTVISYRQAMENILATDSFMEDKLTALKALDDSYGAGNITISIANDKAKIEYMSPYMYFQNAVAACVAEYNDDKTFATSSQGISQASQVERAETYLNNLKRLNDTFVAELSQEIISDIDNCSGRTIESGSCTLDGNLYTVSSPSFCFKNAKSCANEMNHCYNVVNQLVEQKTAELNASADQYNNMVATLFTEQAATFAQFKAAVMQEAGLMNALIPGADFAFPEDNFISMPELTLDPNTNTYIRGGDSAKIGQQLNAMAGKMAKLKTALVAQGEKADKQINQYITKQRENVEKNKIAFLDIVKTCNQRITEATEINRDYNSTMQKNEQDAKSAAGDFCRRFYDLSTNPNAACGDVEELYDASIRAAQFVDINARIYANNLRNLCNETQSEREAGTEEGTSRRESVATDIASACQSGTPWNEAIEPYVQQFAQSLPEGDDRDDILDFLNPESGNVETDPTKVNEFIATLSEEFQDNNTAKRDFRNVVGIIGTKSYTKADSRNSIMAQLEYPDSVSPKSESLSPTNTEVQTKLDIINSDTATAAQKVAAFTQINNWIKPTDDGDSAEDMRSKAAKQALNVSTKLTIPSTFTAQARRIDQAIDQLLPSDSEGDGCDQLLAEAAIKATRECSSSTESSCLEEKYEKALESGRLGGSRAVASLGFSPGNQADINQLFSDLGETDGMACDALASNRRNTVSDIERLDRDILGDQYDDLMRR